MKKSAIALLVCSFGLFGLTTPAGATSPKAGKAEHAVLTVDLATKAGTVTATGAFAGTGTVTTVRSKQSGRTRHFVEELTFGTDSVTIKAVAVRVSRHLDAATCAVTEKDKGSWVITKGTGALAKAKGAGHFVATTNASGTPDASKPHGCDLSHPTGTVVVDARGRVKG